MRPLLLALLSLMLAAPAGAEEPEVVPGELIVHWKSASKRLPLLRAGGRRVLGGRRLAGDSWLYRLEEQSQEATLAAVAELRKLDSVEVVEANLFRRPFKVPNDTHYQLQWYMKAVNLEAAWDRTTGSGEIVVAVVDTGILPLHPDLAGRLLPGHDFISSPTSAADGDGWDADATDAGSEAATSSSLHGTHVAGIIGAASHNGRGVAGVNWGCKILPVRALGVNAGKGTDADIAMAIRWAAGLSVDGAPANTNPARVINVSVGGPGGTTVLRTAVADAQKAGVIVVAAAGNQGGSASEIYPGALPGVITVGATAYTGKRAPYSNFGVAVEIMAPGGSMGDLLPFVYQGKNYPAGVLSTLRIGSEYSYHLYEGTSQAAPIVSGVVALMLGLNPKLDLDGITQALKATANASAQCAEGCGAGLLDAAAALTAVAPKPPPPPQPPSSSLPIGSPCASDGECADGSCGELTPGARTCTRACGAGNECPASSECVSSRCLPSSSPAPQTCVGPSCSEPAERGLIGGCALAGREPRPADAVVAILVALLLLLERRRRRR